MVFPLHMVTLYTLSVFGGASAATHCEYSTKLTCKRLSSPLKAPESDRAKFFSLFFFLKPAASTFVLSLLQREHRDHRDAAALLVIYFDFVGVGIMRMNKLLLRTRLRLR